MWPRIAKTRSDREGKRERERERAGRSRRGTKGRPEEEEKKKKKEEEGISSAPLARLCSGVKSRRLLSTDRSEATRQADF
jgi:hypothetical protein